MILKIFTEKKWNGSKRTIRINIYGLTIEGKVILLDSVRIRQF